MKITILTNGFPPKLDGVGDYSFYLANELSRAGHTVTVLCGQDPNTVNRQAIGDFALPVFPIIPYWNHRAIAPLRQFLNQQRPDWLLVQYVPYAYQQWGLPVWFPFLLKIAKSCNIKICITFHELYRKWIPWPLKHRVTSIVQKSILRQLVLLADELVTSIDLYVQLIRQHTDKLVSLIPISSNIQAVDVSEIEINRLRKQIAPEGELIISTFGQRNHDLLLDVFQRVLAIQPKTTLLICGTLRLTDFGRTLFEQLSSRITVTGYLPAPDVYKYLRASDAFFIPDPTNSLGEGGTSNKSTSLAAGLMAGLPVVGTLGHMNNQLLTQTPGLFLGKAADPDELAALLINSLLDKEAGCRNRKFAEEHLSWRVTAHAYIRLLNQVSLNHDAVGSYH